MIHTSKSNLIFVSSILTMHLTSIPNFWICWLAYVTNPRTLAWSSLVFWATCVAHLPKNNTLFHHPSLDPLWHNCKRNISFPATLLSSIASIRMVQHWSCYLKPSKVDRNISNSPTHFPTPPWWAVFLFKICKSWWFGWLPLSSLLSSPLGTGLGTGEEANKQTWSSIASSAQVTQNRLLWLA